MVRFATGLLARLVPNNHDVAASPILSAMSDSHIHYVSSRLQPQLDWFERAAARAKLRYNALVSTQILATASIPVVNLLTSTTHASTVLAAVATIATGLATQFSYRDEWLRYRRTASALKAVQVRFDAGLAPFVDDARHHSFIEACEQVMSGELDQWETHVRGRGVKKEGDKEKLKAKPDGE